MRYGKVWHSAVNTDNVGSLFWGFFSYYAVHFNFTDVRNYFGCHGITSFAEYKNISTGGYEGISAVVRWY